MKKLLLLLILLKSSFIFSQEIGELRDYGGSSEGFEIDTTVASSVHNAKGNVGYAFYPKNDTMMIQADTLGALNVILPEDTLVVDENNDTIYLTNPNGVISMPRLIGGGYWSETGSSIYYNSGYVGIGTTSPQTELHVIGDATVSDELYVTNKIGIGTTSLTYPLTISGSPPLTLWEDPAFTNPLSSPATTNNIGYISRLSPGNGGMNMYGISNLATASGYRFTGIIGVSDPSNTTSVIDFRAGRVVGGVGANLNATDMAYKFGGFSGVGYLTILGSGNVGIGNDAPVYEIDVSGDINFTGDLYKDDVLFVEGLWQDDGSYISPIEADGVNVEYNDYYRVGGNVILGFNGSTWSTLKVGFGTGGGAGNNTHVGLYTGRGSTTAERNTYIGAYAGDGNITGINNTAVGYQSQNYISGTSASDYNATFGFRSGRNLQGGDYNTFIGANAGDDVGSGSYNTFVGHASGGIQIGSYNTYLGNLAGSSVYNQNYCIAIGDEAGRWNTQDSVMHIDVEGYADEAGSLDSTLIFADFANDYLKINGKLQVTEATHLFYYFGDSTISLSYTTSWAHLTNGTDSMFIQDENDGFTVSNDTITFLMTGDYDFKSKFAIDADNGETVSIRFYNVTQAVGIPVSGAITGRSANNFMSLPTEGYAGVNAGDEIVLQYKGDASGTSVFKNGIIKIYLIHR